MGMYIANARTCGYNGIIINRDVASKFIGYNLASMF